MKHLMVIVILITIATFLFPGEAIIPETIASYLPQPGEMNDWLPSAKPDYAKGDDLFTLINGGAEIYHEYGFKQAISQSYKNKKGKSFNIEIYEMESPEATYGVYSFKTGNSGKPVEAGHEALLEDYYLNCRKGNFMVTVVGFDSEKVTIDALILAAKTVSAKISSTDKKPSLIELLPVIDDKKPNDILYLKGNLALVNNYEFDSGNIFGLKEGIIGDYGDFKLFIFQYADSAESKKYFDVSKAALQKKTPAGKISCTGDMVFLTDPKGLPSYLSKSGRYILILQGKTRKEAKAILDRCGRL